MNTRGLANLGGVRPSFCSQEPLPLSCPIGLVGLGRPPLTREVTSSNLVWDTGRDSILPRAACPGVTLNTTCPGQSASSVRPYGQVGGMAEKCL